MFIYYVGFCVNSGEYKLMGLVLYGEVVYCEKIFKNFFDFKEDGLFWFDFDYFNYC